MEKRDESGRWRWRFWKRVSKLDLRVGWHALGDRSVAGGFFKKKTFMKTWRKGSKMGSHLWKEFDRRKENRRRLSCCINWPTQPFANLHVAFGELPGTRELSENVYLLLSKYTFHKFLMLAEFSFNVSTVSRTFLFKTDSDIPRQSSPERL